MPTYWRSSNEGEVPMSELGKVDSYDELRPANIYDVAANETWLEDQSAQGWHLTGFSGWSGLFAQGSPNTAATGCSPCQKRKRPQTRR